jgi:hypothetical protein
MSPVKTIAAGILLLLVSAAGLVYIIARPKPLLRALPAELVAAEVQPSPTETSTPEMQPSPEVMEQRKDAVEPEAPRIKTFAVTLLSPNMADTFTAPATVALKAEAHPERGLKEIAFYLSPLGESVCQSLARYEAIPGTRRAAVASPPYEFSLNYLAAGAYSLMAVASYETGEQQISQPVVIIVKNSVDYSGPNWKGWRPDYLPGQLAETDPALQPAPTPSPTLLSCPTVKVTADYSQTTLTNKVIFRATVEGGDPIDYASYQWSLSAGEIDGDEYTPEITVKVAPGLDRTIVASVNVGPLHGICPNSAATSVAFDPPRWLDEKTRNRLGRFRDKFEDFQALKTEAAARGYLVAFGDNNACVDEEILAEARIAKRYLVEIAGLPGNRISIVNGGHREQDADSNSSDLELILLRPGEPNPNWLARTSLKPCTRSASPADDIAAGYKATLNRKCPELDEKINYRAHVTAEPHRINTCPDNRRDPSNSRTQAILTSLIPSGVYSNYPSYSYWVNGGRMLNNGKNGIWDLSELKLHPGVYSAIVRADDGCDCQAVAVTSINVTNFCTPCLQLECTPTTTDVSPQLQSFRATVELFALDSRPTFNWTTTRGTIGTIVEDRGTSDVTIDTSMLPTGEPFVVTVSAAGLERYCVNKVSYPAIVGQRCGRSSPYGGFGLQYDGSRRARRRQPAAVDGAPGSEVVKTNLPTVGEGPPTGPNLKETEWINISWTPDVKLDDAVEVKVVYNRTTEKLEVSNGAGEVSEELKLGKLLKNWFGKDYEVFGDLRLRTAGLQCDSCNQEQYQSFDREKLEWSWPLKPNGAGTQIFSLELWVKGEPRDPQSGKLPRPSEKAWTKNSLKVVVKERMLTRNTVFAGGGLCAVLGLGLCVRGLKIYRVGDTYNVGQAVAVGRNVTMNNTTVNQQSSQTGENKDA